jgi:hypothetical protein
MRKRPTSRYIFLGTAIRYLLDVQVGQTIFGSPRLLGNLESVFELLPELELVVSLRLAEGGDLARLLHEFRASEEGAVVTTEQAEDLRTEMRILRATVLAEAGGVFAYVVSDKRFPADKLIDEIDTLFPDGVFDELSQMTQFDVAEAGKCIAFERPTAAAFHLMRGVEGELRDFYRRTVKQKRVKPLLWAPMIDHLGKRSKPPPKPLLDHLDHIRHNFRNPTQHPDASYDNDEAQDLFSLCVDALTRIQRAD